jgi:hypothetical protein
MTVGDPVLELEDLRGRELEAVLTQVVLEQKALMVRLPKGDIVTIQPMPHLKPLPLLKGRIPQGWKDAVYD